MTDSAPETDNLAVEISGNKVDGYTLVLVDNDFEYPSNRILRREHKWYAGSARRGARRLLRRERRRRQTEIREAVQ